MSKIRVKSKKEAMNRENGDSEHGNTNENGESSGVVGDFEDDDDDENENDDNEDEDDEDDDEIDEGDEQEGIDSDSDGDEFEDQGSSDDDSFEREEEGDDDDDEKDQTGALLLAEEQTRSWKSGIARSDDIVKAKETGKLSVQQYLHTDDLSSDDDDIDDNTNTVGRIPLHWYDAYDHIGYDVGGKKVLKRSGKDRLDIAISNQDPLSRHTVYDMYNDREVVLTEREIEIIRRVQAGAYAHPEFKDTPEYIDYFSSIKEIMPLSAQPEPKRRFLPSKWETMRVMKIAKAIKEGRYITMKERDAKRKEAENSEVYMIWKEETEEILEQNKRASFHLPAPKMPLPGHAESYNPPAEYLLTEDEKKQIEDMDPKERPYNFTPTKFSCLRHVKGYDNFIKERFERCLDLYLCPRKLKRRLNIDPETLVPRLPKPRELRPYPNSLCLQYLGHESRVRAIAVSPDGQYLASCSEDKTLRIWEVDTCLCRAVWHFTVAVTAMSWNPNQTHHIIAVAVGSQVVLVATGMGDADETELTETLLTAVCDAESNRTDNDGDEDDDKDPDDVDDDEDNEDGDAKEKTVRFKPTWKTYQSSDGDSSKTWLPPETELWRGTIMGPRACLQLGGEVVHINWHHKGDYLCVLASTGDAGTAGADAVSIHQVSKAQSQFPFKKSPGRVQCVAFHPSRPFLFVVTQQHVRVYHLIEQKLIKKLLSGCKWLACMDVHSSGDHVIVGSFDRRLVWFDLDLSSTPYKTLKYHEKALRGVQFHKRYPLMASASDDGSVHVFHSAVYSDLTKNPMIVPLKVLRGHGVKGGLGVLSIAFHPRQPWIFTAGADGVINLFQDI